ncbi:PfaD family polyunsaturated fatty acid/polyketide biosynthesis protein [Nonomuraea sp. NPDC003560]|uniref:PfaD family polyunsaturated fatty acid/polyketide biosynthesis protein n=1 Tax=Nonomuraea sp. NPDC003560 TaxID=3364341 RepID=UPI003682EE2D
MTHFFANRRGAPSARPAAPSAATPAEIVALLAEVRRPLRVLAPASGGPRILQAADDADPPDPPAGMRVTGVLPAIYPEWLGDRGFSAAHKVRFPYIAGEMANGIATTEMVTSLARAGLAGFFGAAGLELPRVESAVRELARTLGGHHNWGVNLIHTPNEPDHEEAVARLLIRHEVPAVSLSAYLDLTPPAVLCAIRGIRRDAAGLIQRPRRVLAKASRPETAERFMSPAPAALLRDLVERGHLTREEAELADRIAVAEDITVEADSGGHTDNRPLTVLVPMIRALADELSAKHGYARPIRVGAAGGLGTPAAVAAAFAMGAAYVLTGSINQAAVESGLSDDAKALLSKADMTDVTMAPAADMFEMGVRLQVLRRGTLFAARAARLYEVYQAFDSLEEVPEDQRTRLEREIFRAPLAEIWAQTRRFWNERDPAETARAEHDPKHRMALLFRWYLGKSSRWAISGDHSRRSDYQIWCGPAMGAFNRWTAGSFLAEPGHRTVVQIAYNLLEGAAVIARAQQARTAGLPVPPAALSFRPRRLQ